MSTVDQEVPQSWTPHLLTNIECFNAPRTGFMGRAVALRQNGLEFVILAKDESQLDLVTQNFLGIETDGQRTYAATLISSDGVEIGAPLAHQPHELTSGLGTFSGNIAMDETVAAIREGMLTDDILAGRMAAAQPVDEAEPVYDVDGL